VNKRGKDQLQAANGFHCDLPTYKQRAR
jgi:hypothetical protein